MTPTQANLHADFFALMIERDVDKKHWAAHQAAEGWTVFRTGTTQEQLADGEYRLELLIDLARWVLLLSPSVRRTPLRAIRMVAA